MSLEQGGDAVERVAQTDGVLDGATHRPATKG